MCKNLSKDFINKFLKITSVILFFGCTQCVKFVPEVKYNWNDILITPPNTNSDYIDGYQVLHFNTRNKYFAKNKQAINFVQKYLQKAKMIDSDAGVLRYASDQVTIKGGAYLEMGVCTGKTINFIAALNPHQIIYGFDSFEGLPIDWVREDQIIKKGTFAFKEKNFIPPVLNNVKLYKGLFNESLPKFKEEILKNRPISFLHIDCDLYTSTKDVLITLKDNLTPGTIIVFDELYNYPGFYRHEWKALNEFLLAQNLNVEFLAYNPYHEQVAVKLIDGTAKSHFDAIKN